MKYALLITFLVIVTFGLSGCNAPSDSTLVFAPMSADGLDNPDIVLCETKRGNVYLLVADKSGDGHIFRLDYSETGLTKRQAVARIRNNIEARERSSNKSIQSTGEELAVP